MTEYILLRHGECTIQYLAVQMLENLHLCDNSIFYPIQTLCAICCASWEGLQHRQVTHRAWGRWWYSRWLSRCRYHGDKVGRSGVSMSRGSHYRDDQSLCAYTGPLVTVGPSHRMKSTETDNWRCQLAPHLLGLFLATYLPGYIEINPVVDLDGRLFVFKQYFLLAVLFCFWC